MRQGHVNLYVRNAEQSRDWYARVLGLHTYHYRPGRAAFMSGCEPKLWDQAAAFDDASGWLRLAGADGLSASAAQ